MVSWATATVAVPRAQTTIAMASAQRTFMRLEIAIRLFLLLLILEILGTFKSIGELYMK